MPEPARVLRGLDVEPYTFRVLGRDGDPVEEVAEIPEAASAEALAEAFEAGRQAGLLERENEVAALQDETVRLAHDLRDGIEAQKAFVADTAQRLGEQWQSAVRALQPTLASLAIDTAEAVLAAPLSAEQRDATDRSIADAVDALAGDAPIAVTVHPVTLLYLQEIGLAESLLAAHPRLRWEPDNTIAEADWAASTPEAAVQRVAASMLADLRERLGLTA